MESVNLEKGQVHFMDDLLVIEGDDAMKRKRKNGMIGLLLLLLTAIYLYAQYDKYIQEPHQFNWFSFLVRMVLLTMLIIPTAINKIFRFSTINEIPYNAIKKHEPAGSLLKWETSIKLHLSDRKIRMLNFDNDEMKRFRYLLDQKLESRNP
ncbi:MAG TPA: hypothetical protein VK166_09480 [Chitinophagaceae bacterium]|nr:hypothetical protein [Chitinophagaceae bacterium]